VSGTAETAEIGMAVVEDAFLTLREAGLRLPPIPHALAETLTRPAEAVYGTGPLALGDLAGVLAAVEDPAVPAQLGFGHIGHGVASWQFCYQLVTGSLVLFLRLPYGGIDSSDAASLAPINRSLALAEELVVAADAAVPPGGRRALVVLDTLGDAVIRLPGDAAPVESEDPLAEALARLRGG
jgi:hypothetical protein